MKDSISVIIAAQNEQESINDAVVTASKIVSKLVSDYEIIIVDDGSTDTTGKIIASIARKNKRVKVVHHTTNQGFGRAFRDGINYATKKYIIGFPGDNDLLEETFKNLLSAKKNGSIISTYMPIMSDREIIRKIISLLYTKLMNFIFDLHLKYYNGYFICPTRLVQSVNLKSDGFTLFAEIKIRLIKKGVQIYEIPFTYKPRTSGVSKALNFKSIFQTLLFLPKFMIEIYYSS